MGRFFNKEKIAIIIISLIFTSKAFSTPEPINIIAWWSYIDPDIKAEIENKCDAHISIDEYYSNPEFLRRIKSNKYDIAIYSDTVYRTFITAEETASINISSSLVDNYTEALRREYLKAGYLPNTVYYQFALTGFLWNPDVLELNPSDSITQIFEKADSNTIVMLDEHVEVLNLLSKIQDSNESDIINTPSINRVMDLFKEADTVVASTLGNFVTKENFAFAFTWSGEAMEKIHTVSPNLRFLVHPELSHWSKDLLTLISDNPPSTCVAMELSSTEHLNKLATEAYYFSPYGNSYFISNTYSELYSAFVQSLITLKPLRKITPQEYNKLDLDWQKIKTLIQ